MINRLLRRLRGLKPATPAAPPGPEDRLAGVARLDDPSALLRLMDDPELVVPARKRLRQLIERGLDPVALAELNPDLARRRHLLDAATNPAHWQPLLASLSGDDILADVAGHHPLAAVRLAAAGRLTDESAMRRVERACRDRDKVVARQMRETLERLRQARQRLGEIDVRLHDLEAEVRQMARIMEEAGSPERLQWLCGQHAELLAERKALAGVMTEFGQSAPPPPGTCQRFEALTGPLLERVAADRAEAAAQAEREAARARAREDQASVVASLERLITQLDASLGEHPAPATERNALRAALELEDGRWQAVCVDTEPTPDLAERHARASATLQTLLTALGELDSLPLPPEVGADDDAATIEAALETCRNALDALSWPRDIARPASVLALEAACGALDERRAALAQQRQGPVREVRRALGRLEHAIDRGQLRRARGIRKDIDALLEQLEDADHPGIRQRAERLQTRLEELADWQRFATTPKRRELVDAMESLAAEDALPPETRAARVRHLREQWNALGPARDDEGRALVERFNAAAEAAFAPCRSHFEAVAERQRENAAQRERICSEIETFIEGYDWNAADWRAVERIYQEARREWRRHADVDPRQRELPRRYHALMRDLRGRLEPRWQANIAAKEALVRDAEALAESADESSASAAKRLQAEWQAVDITPRSADRRLWKAFRAACDRIFAEVEVQTETRRTAMEAELDRLEQELERLETVCREQAALPLRQRQEPERALLAELEGLAGALDAGMPKGHRRRLAGLTRRLGTLRKTVRQLERDWTRREALLVAGAELATGCDSADGNGHAAVIDLELALGCDSPPEDAALRMERQVKRLESGMRGSEAGDPVAAAVAQLLESGVTPDLATRARAAIDSALDGRP